MYQARTNRKAQVIAAGLKLEIDMNGTSCAVPNVERLNPIIDEERPMNFSYKKTKSFGTLFFFLVLLPALSTNGANAADIHFHVQPNLNDSQSLLIVNFDCKSGPEGLIRLKYENSSWGDNDIFNCIKNLSVDPKPIAIDRDPAKSMITIKTTPNSNNEITYSIGQDFDGPLLNKHRYRPILDEKYFHILGMRLFMIPEGVFESEASKANIAITWGDVPEGGIFHSTFGAEYKQNIEVTREELYATFFVGGDFRRYSFKYKDDTIYFITRGQWKVFNDRELLNLLKETIYAQNDFWNDPRHGMYSVSLLPTFEAWTMVSQANSVGGSGLTNSFISFASNNAGTTLSRMRWLYNHELLHKWIGRTIINENEVEQYWFSEGFTDYYTYKLMLKSDRVNVEEFISLINKRVIIPHHEDPINTIPNSDLTFQKYWSNYSKYQKLPYRRGLLYAFLIDTQIKKQSNYKKSLDNLMQGLLKMALEDEGMRFNHSLFKRLLSEYLDKTEAFVDFEKYIIKGQLIDFTDKLQKGLSLENQENIALFKIQAADKSELATRLKR